MRVRPSILLLAASVALGQKLAVQPHRPVKLTLQGTPDTPWFHVLMENTSEDEIVAFVLKVDFYDRSGKKVLANVVKQYKLHASASRPFGPGKTWLVKNLKPAINRATGEALEYEVSLDYVLWANGSEWGPNELGWNRDVRDEAARRGVLIGPHNR